MKATIEHSSCPYCDEVTELYFRIINTILFSTDEAELRTGMERLQEKTRLDDYFVLISTIFVHSFSNVWTKCK